MTIHYKYGGSTAARLIQCPANLKLSSKLTIVEKHNPYAQRGTDLHNIQEKLRNEQLFPDELDIAKMFPKLAQSELLDYIETTELVYNMTDEVLDKYNLDSYICEPFVQANHETGGSIDLLAYNDEYTLILDYKMGHNKVDALDNKQGLFYFYTGFSDPTYLQYFRNKSKNKKFVFCIIQPNQSKPDVWEITSKDLDNFITDYTKAVKLSKSDTPPVKAGDSCKYCNNAPYCTELRTYAQRALYLQAKQKSAIEESLRLAKLLENWSKEVFAEAEAIMKQGEQLKGFKLVEKQARKYWKSEEQLLNLIDTLADKELFLEVPKPLSPAKMLKIVKGDDILMKVFEDEIVKKSSGYTVVPDSDKRKAVNISISEVLKNLVKK